MKSPNQRITTALIALAIGVGAFVYRFNTLGGALAGFDNDHFLHLTRAEAVLNGELPLRDFADAGLGALWPPLLYTTSAAAQHLLGPTLRSEAILTVGLLAFGAMLLYWLAAALAQRALPAALATVLAVGLGPALYNYPKIVPYAVAMAAMVVYARQPNRRRLGLLAATVVVAALFRHDHGVFLSLSSAVLIGLVHWPYVSKPLMTFATFVLAGVLPGVVFAQAHGGFIRYLTNCLETTRLEAARTVAPAARFQLDWSHPWLERGSAPPPPKPRIGVLWKASVTPEARARAERELGLSDSAARDEALNWSYVVDDGSLRQLARIVADQRIADTDGIDRKTFTITAEPPPQSMMESLGLTRWRFAPGIFREANAAPWLYTMAWAIVLGALVCLAVPPLRRAVEVPVVPIPAVASVAVLGFLLVLAFLRNSAPQRLPDASAPLVVLGAWLMAAIPRAALAAPWAVRATLNTLLAGAIGLSVLSVSVIGGVPQQIVGTGITDGIAGLPDRGRDVWNMLGALPAGTAGIEPQLGRTVGYLRRCSSPFDRLLVGDNLPELNYFAGRRFAAGRESFFSRFYSSPESQQEAIERWSRQLVPLVLMQPQERFDVEFASDYPHLADYLRSHYTKRGTVEAKRGLRLDVWVDQNRAAHPDVETGLPCLVAR